MFEIPIMTLLQSSAGTFNEAIQIAMGVIADPLHIGFIVLATLLGVVMGVIPGLGGAITLALLIPITFDMEPNVAIMILAAALGGTNFGGSVTAILLNTPGSAPNAATLLDGYPMARQGRAGEAIAASAVSSASGALLGLVLLVAAVPFIRPVTLAFGSPELFWLALLGLTVIAVATTGSVLTDLIAGGFGLMLAFHGLNPVTGTARFTWGSSYLLSGIQLIPAIIGLFALAEMIRLASQGSSIAEAEVVSGGRLDGIKSVLENWFLFLRSAVLGWGIGVIPGVGGTVANFVAYLQAKQTSSDQESFGEGNVKGVIASEAANDAKDGGSMLPTLGLGVPGSASTAVLLGAFILHGVTPGPLLFQENLQLVFIIVFALVISNLLTSLIGLVSINPLAKLTKISISTLAPIVIVIGLLGSFVIRGNFGDVLLAGFFGVFGFAMLKFNISRIALVIALVLGPMAEQNFHRSLQISQGDFGVLFTPLSLVLILVIVVALLIPLRQALGSMRQKT
ncbi:tricarboxylic transporter [Halobellus sp. Atlit-38R]|uniref:tripartite tricarboxylate transporter permease n=1 Tax=Halobellus sp. Atlit-38R TaxID=2282131 RepID=UPI000EF1F92C|nr:tripartite tricarboxylate transporter permease [Halobellus sp. Atlit-38R]RLM84271.1 tricarboxylic transporter [Halobellus sp. Atlit-38R]